jgi:hypothetical protein
MRRGNYVASSHIGQIDYPMISEHQKIRLEKRITLLAQ